MHTSQWISRKPVSIPFVKNTRELGIRQGCQKELDLTRGPGGSFHQITLEHATHPQLRIELVDQERESHSLCMCMCVQSLCMCDMVSTCILCLLIHRTCSLGWVHAFNVEAVCMCMCPWYVPCTHTGASAGYHCAVLFTNTHVRVLTSSMT